MAGSQRDSKLLPAPGFLQPMECLPVSQLPEGPDWAYEVKLDGYRAQALCAGSQTRLLSRNGNDLGQRFPALARELAAAVPSNSIVDGELVALDPTGRPRFHLIQNAATSGARFVFFAFDLLRLRGADLTEKPLSARRALLRKELRQSEAVQFSESFQIPARQMLELARSQGLEGVIAKRLSSTYEQGQRSGAWVKMRLNLAQELVIGGYTPGAHGFDALLVGFYRGGALHFCASVRNGFIPAAKRTLYARLAPLRTAVCPFINLPDRNLGRWGQGLTAAKMKGCAWLRPELVAECRFLEWTLADRLRHASFVTLREDKEASSVVKEGEAAAERKAPEAQSLTRKQQLA